MNIQIYGRNKCFDTQKAERYFKERRIPYQRIDLDRFGLSKRELESVKAATGLSALINAKSREYGTLNVQYMRSDETKMELLTNHPKLFTSPIVRNGKLATVGYKPEIWREWEERKD